MATRGRKPMNPEDRVQTKNVTLDADLVSALNEMADRFTERFGFRPTLSQTVRHLIKSQKET